jgi:uncharacterized protein YcfJ
MRSVIFGFVILLGLGMMTPSARAIGCLSGGAAGALAGHMAGHGVLGALGGCVAGHAWKKHQLRQQDYQSYQNYDRGRRQYDPDYRSPYSQ